MLPAAESDQDAVEMFKANERLEIEWPLVQENLKLQSKIERLEAEMKDKDEALEKSDEKFANELERLSFADKHQLQKQIAEYESALENIGAIVVLNDRPSELVLSAVRTVLAKWSKK